MVLNSIKLKQLNIELVKKALRSGGDGTKNSIADATGLSVATCRNILEDLVASGEVVEVDSAPSTGGRPSRRFEYNKKFNYLLLMYVSIEGSEENIYCSVADMLGTTVYEQTFRFKSPSIEDLDEVVVVMLEKYKNINVISIGIPGVVDNGRVDLCDVESLAGFDVEGHLSDKFGLAVAVENDVNSSALGYYRNMKSGEPESLVYIFYPFDCCAGAGIIINGKVLRGKSCFAGELGYLPGMHGADEGDEQPPKITKPEYFINIAVKTILTINCILNPECIVITGKFVTDGLVESIKKRLDSEAQPNHVPTIDFESDMHQSYIRGLFFAGMERLSCELKVVRRY